MYKPQDEENLFVKKVVGAADEARSNRLDRMRNSEITKDEYIPVIFIEAESQDLLNFDRTLNGDFTSAEPLRFELNGGEILEVARVFKKDDVMGRDSYSLAWRITGFNAKFSNEENLKLLKHPWVVFKHTVGGLKAIPLGSQPLDKAEESEITRWAALFNSKDIIIDNLEFKIEDYPKLLVLQSLGKSLSEKPSQYTTEGIRTIDDLCKLFNQAELTELFGASYMKWVEQVLITIAVIGSDLITWPLDLIKNVMFNPETESPLNDEELEKIVKFLTRNNLAMKVKDSSRGEEYVSNPSVVKKVREFPDEE